MNGDNVVLTNGWAALGPDTLVRSRITAYQLAAEDASVVVDCETSYMRLELAGQLACQLEAPTVLLEQLNAFIILMYVVRRVTEVGKRLFHRGMASKQPAIISAPCSVQHIHTSIHTGAGKGQIDGSVWNVLVFLDIVDWTSLSSSSLRASREKSVKSRLFVSLISCTTRTGSMGPSNGIKLSAGRFWTRTLCKAGSDRDHAEAATDGLTKQWFLWAGIESTYLLNWGWVDVDDVVDVLLVWPGQQHVVIIARDVPSLFVESADLATGIT